jgi:hypothetical protein
MIMLHLLIIKNKIKPVNNYKLIFYIQSNKLTQKSNQLNLNPINQPLFKPKKYLVNIKLQIH